MGKNVKQLLVEQGIYSNKSKIGDLLRGKEVTVIGNRNSHNYGSNGTTFTISSNAIFYATYVKKAKKGNKGNAIRYSDLEIELSLTKDELKEQLEKLTHEYEKKREEIKQKILFLEETGEEEYDPQTFKVFSVLQTLNGKDSDMQKAKQIVKLIN